ncbi:isoprenylcysteine carboxylmethyltransferase family protein [Rhizobium viscosum]|uniref:Protein-S-isoprenylcysteine O-methyltransferase Ste14 n=1 Tax=Rhizobium viscosum TaxID=1673 RepID=A0ABR9ITS7_RHIVS|nr:methyltransferase [Rhizobium viscosum]MBE1506607.1 protein-S-isoprenylcysteine O-methyltransferase Ste14 [Rhizobium viscosum]
MRKYATSIPSLDGHFLLDMVERILIVYLFARIVLRIVPGMGDEWAIVDFTLLLSEGACAAFIVTRRTTRTTSMNPADWLVTAIGTLAPLCVEVTRATPLLPLVLCEAILMLGFVVQISAKFTLRRSFGLAPANRGVKIGGPYRFLRHPMYAGYLMTHIGFFCAHPTRWNLAVYSAALAAQCCRILAEERVLSKDTSYVEFMKRTPHRLIPFIF